LPPPEIEFVAFADALRGVFSSVVEGPWCYLEFGDVESCRDPSRRDERLTRAARTLADKGQASCDRPPCPDDADRERARALLGPTPRSSAARLIPS
jgi:hypothetical protein